MKDLDAVYTNDKWEFNAQVADCFEDMLERSIPQYKEMRRSILELSTNFLKDKKQFNLLDLGCSNGLGLKDYMKRYGAKGRYLGIDCSKPMLEQAKNNFKSWIDLDIVNFEYMDLRTDFPLGVYDVILVELTLMFTPINYRQKIIQNIYDKLSPGGVTFIVEKVLGESAILTDIFVNEYHNMKYDNGYSKEQIERKKLSLEGVQVPVTNSWNIELLKQAGFKHIDVFWRWMNFVGYIAIK